MRNILALAALLAFMPVANAQSKADMTMNGEYRVRYQFDQAWGGDKDNNTNKNTVVHRFKLDNHFKVNEKFGAQLTLLHNAQWGNFNVNAAPSASDSGTAVPNGISDNQNMILVNQAYGTWMLNDAWTLKFGRGGFTMADGSVVSQNDWEATPYAFDGVLANYEHEMFRLGIFGVKAIDGVSAASTTGYVAPNGNDDPEANFFGASMDWKSLPEFLKMANVHVMQVNKDETGLLGAPAAPKAATDASQKAMRYGIVLAGDTAGIDYKLNYAAHTGEGVYNGTKFDIEGNMMAAEVGYSLPEMMKSRISLAYHIDTGSSSATKVEKYDAFYTEKHNSAGMMDVLAWGNLTFIKAAYSMSPMDQVDAGLQYWKFNATESTANISQQTAGNNGATIIPARTASTSDDLGQEIDLYVTKKYDGGFAINAWVGMYMPGSYTKDQVGSDDTYNMFFVEGKMSF